MFRSITWHLLIKNKEQEEGGRKSSRRVCIPPVAAGLGDELGRRKHRADARCRSFHQRVTLSVLTFCRHASSLFPTTVLDQGQGRLILTPLLQQLQQRHSKSARGRVKRENEKHLKQTCIFSMSCIGVLYFRWRGERGSETYLKIENRSASSVFLFRKKQKVKKRLFPKQENIFA